jgi:hypothetical protein
VAVGVVERLEAIGVNHRHGQRLAIPAGAAELNCQPVVHVASIEEAGQGIARRQLQEFVAARDSMQTFQSGKVAPKKVASLGSGDSSPFLVMASF